MGYFKDAFKGLAFQSILRISVRLIGFIKISVLARFLGPVEFGIFGIASLVLALLETMTDTGTNILLIQEKGDDNKYLSSVFTISVVRGIAISSLIIIFIPLIEYFFNIHNLNNLMLLIAFVPFIRGFINPAIIKFEKDLRFDKELILRLCLYTVDAAVSIYIAIKYQVVEGLIIGMIVAVVFELLFSWIFINPKPSITFRLKEFKNIINRGKWITLTGIFNYLFHNIDDVVVGKMLGVYSLGLYQLSYKIATLPIYETGEIFGRVTLPVYSKIANEKDRLRKAFIKTTNVITLLVIPVGLILFLFTKEIVLLILGPKWLEAVNVIKILLIFSVLRSISGSVAPLFYALNKQEHVTKYIYSGLFVLSIIIIPFTKFLGLEGAAISTVIATIFTIPIIIKSLKKEIL